MKKEVLIIVFILGLLFIWFQLRPAIARNYCSNAVKQQFQGKEKISMSLANNTYRICLVKWGLKGEDLLND